MASFAAHSSDEGVLAVGNETNQEHMEFMIPGTVYTRHIHHIYQRKSGKIYFDISIF